jgi:hypothetical protein
LKAVNYKQSMESPFRDKYVGEIDEEQYKMSRNEVFEEVNVDNIPPGTKLLDSTWDNKRKADGSTRCRLAIRGFQQIDGVHFDASDKAAPVVCDVTIRVVLILAIMANWLAWIVDVDNKILEPLASGTNAVTSRYLNTTAQFGSCNQVSQNSLHTIHLVHNIAYPTE